MISIIIAAIGTLLCWVKVSKDTEEQIQLASWTKTIILAILTFVVLVFYLKTYQVTTVANFINVHDYKCCMDSAGNNIDTIKVIRITNKLSPGITENLLEGKIKKSKDERSSVALGSVYIAQQFHPTDSVRKYSIKYNVESLKGQGKDTLNGDFFDIPLSNYCHIYDVNYLRTSVPSMIPLLPSFIEKKNIEGDGMVGVTITGSHNLMYGDNETKAIKRNLNPDGSIDETEGSKEMFDNAYAGVCFYGDTVKADTVKTIYNSYYSNIANTFNFFTAADISQYIEAIDIESDCYVEKLIYAYDLPIAINPYDSCMVANSNSFSVRGKYLNDNIVKGYGLQFHVTLPTLANLQLIRSLILTTILTALAVLLFANIFYLFRKYSMRYLEKHREQISEVRLNKFKNRIFILLTLLLIFIIYVTIKIANEQAFHISLGLYSFLLKYYEWVIVCIAVLIISLICFMFRNVIIQNKNNKKNK